MRRTLSILIVLLLSLSVFSGCDHVLSQNGGSQTTDDALNTNAEGGLLLRDGNVKSISVSSLPNGYDYSFKGKDAEKIIDYLSDLSLIEQFEENPNEYTGMTWVISLEYEEGDALQIYHFGNMFIRIKGGSWYKMTDDEALRFEALLEELN